MSSFFQCQPITRAPLPSSSASPRHRLHFSVEFEAEKGQRAPLCDANRSRDPQWTATRLGRLRSRLTPSPDALAKRASASASRFDCRGKLDPGSTGNEVPSSTVRRARSSGVILKFQPRYRSASRYPACSRRNFHAPLCLAPVKPRYGLLGIVTPRVNVEARGNFSKPPPASLRDFEINFMLAANASPRGAFGLPKLSTVSSRPQLDLVKSAKKSWSTVTST